MTNDELDLVLDYLYVRVPALQSEDLIRKEVFGNNNNRNVLVSEILTRLLESKYVYRQQFPHEDETAFHQRTQYSLTIPGIRFYQRATIAKRPFHSKEQEQMRQHGNKGRQQPLEGGAKRSSWLDRILGIFSGSKMSKAS